MYISDPHKVSVITCFLNVEKYLEEAIDSVLNQHYVCWELLLIDDGSTDNSTEIAKAYAQKYPDKIFYFEHQNHTNKGLSASRNVGISKATSNLIAFLDADDAWAPEYLANQIKIMEKYSPAMICEATQYWYNWDDPAKKDIIISVGSKPYKLYNPPQLMLDLYPLGAGAAPCVCGILIKKEILLRHGGFDESFTGMYEDQVFLSKIYMNESVYISGACNNKYRQRSDSLVATSQGLDYHLIRRRFLEWFKEYLHQHRLNNIKVHRKLAKALMPYHHPLLYYIIVDSPQQILSIFKKAISKFLKRIKKYRYMVKRIS
jgi:glycosyltransferase involved in cell wall biosynthesis